MEEYYTGGLFLGPGNGITDGSVFLIGLFIYCGVFGTELFSRDIIFTISETTYTYRFSHIFAICILVSQTIAVLYK